MGEFVKKIFGGGQAIGPSDAERAAQTDARNKAAEQQAESDRLAALSTRISSRRDALSFKDKLGG